MLLINLLFAPLMFYACDGVVRFRCVVAVGSRCFGWGLLCGGFCGFRRRLGASRREFLERGATCASKIVQNCCVFSPRCRLPPIVPFEDVRKATYRCFDASQVQTSQSFKQA